LLDPIHYALGHRLESARLGGEPDASSPMVTLISALSHKASCFYGANHGGHGLLCEPRSASQFSKAKPILFKQWHQYRPESRSDLWEAISYKAVPQHLIPTLHSLRQQESEIAASQICGPPMHQRRLVRYLTICQCAYPADQSA
jgi:hypothetical protein